MTTDEFQLRDLARELRAHYIELHAHIHTTPSPPEIKTRNSIKGQGPKTPGNWLWVNRYVEMEQNLRELALNAFGKDGIGIHIAESDFTAPRLCHLIAWHAQALTELDWAADLIQELEDQARTINKWVNPPEVPIALIRQAKSSEQLLTAAHVAAAATAATGHRIDRKQVTYLGRAGYITTHKDKKGKSCYQLNDIINFIKKREQKPQK
ncbi:TPA: hypothetical protein I8V27_002350 [Corynebacterium striatum]|nr:hypothetical protein [Corynebacterium striatum]HAT1158430.1 hypothetical protein [Corynebacterium striatum]HAT1161177.1 hypothetical protein [Corynebacterium striatum]HAT1163890.1 hypothetical protein [Corynebacterium striatum]HAT1166645.1 hypothetical protein [Corynebacterium striatum]